MMLIPTYLAPSSIHGIGIFTAQPVAKGTRIWEFTEGLDLVLPESLLETSREPILSHLKRYTYPHASKPGMRVLDGDDGRFMNHSKTPNTDFKTPAFGIALVDMPAGTELTCDYGEFDPGFTLD